MFCEEHSDLCGDNVDDVSRAVVDMIFVKGFQEVFVDAELFGLRKAFFHFCDESETAAAER